MLTTKPPRSSSELCPEHADDVVGGDDPGELVALIDDREGLQVVLVKQFRHLVIGILLMRENEWLLRQRQHRLRRLRQYDSGQWDGGRECSLGIDQVNGADDFHT